MRRYITSILILMVLSLPVFSDTVLLHMQYPETGVDLNLSMVTAYLENGIVDALFDNGMIVFGESHEVTRTKKEWDRFELQEMRTSAGAEWLLSVQVFPEEGEEFTIYYVFSGGAGLAARSGRFPLTPNGAPLDTWCYLRGQEMVDELISYRNRGE